MQTISEFIAKSCERHAQRCALQHKSQGTWVDTSYAELWAKVELIAAGLGRLEMKNQQHLAILAPSSPEWVASYLAILRAGGVAVPVDKELKAAELEDAWANPLADERRGVCHLLAHRRADREGGDAHKGRASQC